MVCAWCGKTGAKIYEWHNGVLLNRMALCAADYRRARAQGNIWPVRDDDAARRTHA